MSRNNPYRAGDLKKVAERWDRYSMPKTMTGTFLDIGCWGGGFLLEAVTRGADMAVGVDSVRTLMPEVEEIIKEERPDNAVWFLQMDLYSPHWFSLPRFDYVLCAGVIYHVPDLVGALQRIKAVTKDGGYICLESAVGYVEGGDVSLMYYMVKDHLDSSYSNWFVPNVRFIYNLGEEIGLEVLEDKEQGGNRHSFIMQVRDSLPMKFLPRKRGRMLDE